MFTTDITDLLDQVVSLNRQLEQGKINYNPDWYMIVMVIAAVATG